jgi:3-oxoadipate CoA-transferase beta subunit
MTSPAAVTVEHADQPPLDDDAVARRLAADIPDGSYVNLGIGRPTSVARHLGPERDVVLHTENGMLGMGPEAADHEADPDLVNAGKVLVTELPGASYFDHGLSFAMMRGGHIDVSVMGAYQVSQHGDLANWHTGSDHALPAVGGAMDLAVGARAVFVIMPLLGRDGAPKVVPVCGYPLTGRRCVTRIYTDLALFHVDRDGLVVVETYGTTVAGLEALLDLDLRRLGG